MIIIQLHALSLFHVIFTTHTIPYTDVHVKQPMETTRPLRSASSSALSSLHTWAMRKLFANPLWHMRTSVGLRRDLRQEMTRPHASIPITVRDIRPSDVPLLLPHHCATLPRREKLEIKNRRRLLEQGVQRCFVAIDTSTGRPCFIQWAFCSLQNGFIQEFFRGRFPILRPDQILLENAYTPPDYRGKGIMPDAMHQICEALKTPSTSEIITFVDQDNHPSIKGCKKAGFAPFVSRHDYAAFKIFHRRCFLPMIPPSASQPVTPHTNPL